MCFNVAFVTAIACNSLKWFGPSYDSKLWPLEFDNTIEE